MSSTYFLVNNLYQLKDAILHAENIKSVKYLICSHNISKNDVESFVDSCVFIEKMTRNKFDYLNFFRLLSIRKTVDAIKFSSGDKLVFYTEFEYVNTLIVERFSKASKNIYLLEDGGFATYVSLLHKPKYSIINRYLLAKFIFRNKKTNVFFMDDVCYPRIDDSLINFAIVRMKIKPVRDINTKLLNDIAKISLPFNTSIGKETVLFLNQPLYNEGLSPDSYFEFLFEVLRKYLSKNVNFNFKFHPRESVESRNMIKRGLSDFNINFIDDNSPVETYSDIQISKINKCVTSFSSGALFLKRKGVAVEFIFNEETESKVTMSILKRVVEELNVNSDHEFNSLKHIIME